MPALTRRSFAVLVAVAAFISLGAEAAVAAPSASPGVSGWHGRGYLVNAQYGGVVARFYRRSGDLYAPRPARCVPHDAHNGSRSAKCAYVAIATSPDPSVARTVAAGPGPGGHPT